MPIIIVIITKIFIDFSTLLPSFLANVFHVAFFIFFMWRSRVKFFFFFFNFPFFSVEAELDIVKANIRKKDQKDLD